jgi:ParB family transcriptional regulator, chromosome partitioning protein
MQTPEFKNIPLKEIVADPGQPRTFYDAHAMDELTASIKEKGVLQPILVRPAKKGYMIVCGERRYKASLSVNAAFKDRNTIPAIVRVISDEEALEMQIIENLQRKDVHPMEEAVAFKSLLDHGKDIKEIAARVGKSEFYARQRVKLTALTKDWQTAFFQNRLSVTDALGIALFDTKIQQDLFKRCANGTGKIEISTWTMEQYRGNLVTASFDLNDAMLDKKAGACTGCKFNTATALLFGDEEMTARCLNIPCFKNKCALNFTKQLELALQDPEVIFVQDNWTPEKNNKEITAIEKVGHNVLAQNSYDQCYMPNVPDYEDFKDDNADDYTSEEDLKAAFEKEEVEDYKTRLQEYKDKIAGGKFKKAFMVTGNHAGKYVYIKLKANKPAGSSKATTEKEKEQKLTVADIDSEIQRLNIREKRSKELDDNKVWDKDTF